MFTYLYTLSFFVLIQQDSWINVTFSLFLVSAKTLSCLWGQKPILAERLWCHWGQQTIWYQWSDKHASGEFMDKTFQAAQLTHKRPFDHIWALLQNKEIDGSSVWQILKKIFCRSDRWSKISRVLVVQLEMFSP